MLSTLTLISHFSKQLIEIKESSDQAYTIQILISQIIALSLTYLPWYGTDNESSGSPFVWIVFHTGYKQRVFPPCGS